MRNSQISVCYLKACKPAIFLNAQYFFIAQSSCAIKNKRTASQMGSIPPSKRFFFYYFNSLLTTV